MYPPTGNITPAPGTFGSDLVDLIDIDDTVLSEFDITIRLFDKIAHEIVDVVANISGLRKFGGVCLDERHTDQLGHIAHQISLSHPGRSEE